VARAAAGGDAYLPRHGTTTAGDHATAVASPLQFRMRQTKSVEHFVDVGMRVIENLLHGGSSFAR
jgi:hypothetical protein